MNKVFFFNNTNVRSNVVLISITNSSPEATSGHHHSIKRISVSLRHAWHVRFPEAERN